MISLFISAFVTLFVVLDPPGCVPIFAGLTSGATRMHQQVMAMRSTIIAGIVLVMFGVFGEAFLGTLGISLAAFKIAGGVMVFLIAIDMVFEKRTERREQRADEITREAMAAKGTVAGEDISVFPMGIPMLAGPGSIASIMLLTARAKTVAENVVVLAALIAVLIVTVFALLSAGPLMKLMGKKLEAMITRLLGVILSALAAQFIVDGIREAFKLA